MTSEAFKSLGVSSTSYFLIRFSRNGPSFGYSEI